MIYLGLRMILSSFLEKLLKIQLPIKIYTWNHDVEELQNKSLSQLFIQLSHFAQIKAVEMVIAGAEPDDYGEGSSQQIDKDMEHLGDEWPKKTIQIIFLYIK